MNGNVFKSPIKMVRLFLDEVRKGQTPSKKNARYIVLTVRFLDEVRKLTSLKPPGNKSADFLDEVHKWPSF